MLLLKLIEQIPFFWQFTPDERSQLVEGETFFVTYQKGNFLIREGDQEDSALLILIKGRVAITKSVNPDVTLATLEPGAVIGEMSFLTGQPRATNVIAREEVTAFRIASQEMESLDVRMQMKIQHQLILILVDRLGQVNQTLAKQKQANQTLAKALAGIHAERL
ncbi:MAG: cyclic nucleotide-binding domain-containing protein [Magnetococcales bacterium]|nr:cyclic nucleotide-binding domain-containing protein [Magnetococcales bacterium]